MAIDPKTTARSATKKEKKKDNINSILKKTASKTSNITNEKKQKVSSGKIIKTANNRYFPREDVYNHPEWVAAINQLKKQGLTEAEAFSSVTSSSYWRDFSFIGDDG